MALPEKRGVHAAQTLLPHLWGAVPESIEQLDEYVLDLPQQPTVHLASLYWRQERQANAYWLLATVLPASDYQGNTALLPLPYQLPKWERFHVNRAIELPEFRARYSISSTDFMHSYYTIRRPLIERFLALPNPENWLLVRQNKVYLAVPKTLVAVDIQQLDAAEEALEKEGQEALALGEQFLGLLAGMGWG